MFQIKPDKVLSFFPVIESGGFYEGFHPEVGRAPQQKQTRFQVQIAVVFLCYTSDMLISKFQHSKFPYNNYTPIPI